MEKTPFLKTKTGLVVAIVVGVVIIFLVGSEYRAYQVRKAISDVFNTDVAQTKKNTNIVEKKIGEEFELATIKVKVNGVEEKQTINLEFSNPITTKENSKFVYLDVDITNLTKDSFVFDAEGLNLTDSQGRNFKVYDENIGADNFLLWKELTPSITQKGVLVYELPNDATSYALAIDKGGTNDRYMVKLK